MPVAFWKMTPPTCAGLPTPTVPAVALSGLALSQAISSLQIVGRQRLLADDQHAARSASSATGSKSFTQVVRHADRSPREPTWLVQLPMPSV